MESTFFVNKLCFFDSIFFIILEISQKKRMLSNYSDDVEGIDISNQRLTILPDLSRFKNLQRLECFNNQLTSLLLLPSSLQLFNCSNNRLTSLPPLPSTLQELYCSSNRLTSLPPLPSTLQRLICYTNQLTHLPTLPSTLQQLDCSINQLTHLPPLPSILQRLLCYTNQLTHLPPLPFTLKVLICNYNQLTCLPPLPSTLKGLSYSNNSFSLPLKTIEQWKFYSGFSQLKTIHQNDLAKKIQRKWRTYWDEPYKIQQWEDGTTSPICRCQENYFNEWNQHFL